MTTIRFVVHQSRDVLSPKVVADACVRIRTAKGIRDTTISSVVAGLGAKGGGIMKIKCISLWQPWAWAMAKGLKLNETRHWSTNYRGPLAIHAAKKPFHRDDYSPTFNDQLSLNGFSDDQLVYGAVLCVVELFAVESTNYFRPDTLQEALYGNCEVDRFAWRTRNCRELETPVPLVGHQGLFDWDVPVELIEKLGLVEQQGLLINA
jgi:hypothetical protein